MSPSRSRVRNAGRPLDREISLLLSCLDEAFDRRAWHGTNFRGSIRGVGAEEAAWHPAPGRHSIWEIVLHAAYWKYAVRRQLTGADRGSFTLKGSNWFPIPDKPPPDPAGWRAALTLVITEHRLLRDAVTHLPVAHLSHKTPRGNHTFRRIVYGVALHDVHHEGQIQLIKRLWQSRGEKP